jgi:hypothetical protein
MRNKATLLFMLIVCHGLSMTMGMWEAEDKEHGHPLPRKLFLMEKSKRMVNTDAGEMRVLESYGRIHERRLHIGIIDMEPNSLFVPQYLDSTLILFVRSGIYHTINQLATTIYYDFSECLVSATVKFDKLCGNLVCVSVEFEENVNRIQ